MEERPIALSPLADPVVGAIFDSVENAGLAAQSLVESVLKSEGVKLGNIISVTPQKIAIPNVEVRSTRVDIFFETDKKERILVEVQMYKEPLLERNMLAVSQDIATSIPKNSTVWRVRELFPKIYVINIMNYSTRTDNDDFIQPIKLMYTKPPAKTAFEHLQIFNIELPKFRKKKHDLTDRLDAWLYIFDTAEQENKTVEEVISMDETLKATVTEDPGLKQFIENYDRISADGEMRKEYFGYIRGMYYLNGLQRSAFLDGKIEDARNMLLDGLKPEKISQYTNLPIETIREIRL
ncbi:MAG: Rpn family recombination-promoting nuclease/putative transposase [Ruminococcus sp.]|jgi:predicted transposase/invertase (TIGR01784 family)|nr:Rpn family recombination-promoting nuclease/putative transposase [Ruminococcus sp.]